MAPNKTANYKLTFIESIIYGIVFSVCYLISLLPFCILYIMSDALYLLVYKFVGYRRNVVYDNLKGSFLDKNDKEIKDIEKKFYRFLCDYIVETLKLMTMSRKEMRKRVIYRNFDVITDAENRGQSVSLYLGHYGNWEWMTSIVPNLKESSFGGQVYHILENRVADKLFLYIRTRMGGQCVTMNDILRRRVECKSNNQVMVMGYIADQSPEWHNIHHWLDFLNRKTPVITGTERITKRFNDAAVYISVSRPKRGYYEVECKLMEENTRDIPDWKLTEMYYKELEASIVRHPELWLWTHKRWKRTYEGYLRWKDGLGDDFGKRRKTKN